MFIRTDRLPDGRVRYYLVESYRKDGKVKQRRLQYLGRDKYGLAKKYPLDIAMGATLMAKEATKEREQLILQRQERALEQQEKAVNRELGVTLLFSVLLHPAPV